MRGAGKQIFIKGQRNREIVVAPKKKIRAHQGELHFPPDGREVLESNGATLSKSVDHLVQNVLDVIGKAGHQLDLVGQDLAHSLWGLHC